MFALSFTATCRAPETINLSTLRTVFPSQLHDNSESLPGCILDLVKRDAKNADRDIYPSASLNIIHRIKVQNYINKLDTVHLDFVALISRTRHFLKAAHSASQQVAARIKERSA